MKHSVFGDKLTGNSGILELMEDLGNIPVDEKADFYMLGGGNPAHLPEIDRIVQDSVKKILADGTGFYKQISRYDTPRGNLRFCDAVAALLSREYGWPIKQDNVAVVNSSQLSFFYLLNMFSGKYRDNTSRKMLFPLCPEYIGYADQGLERGTFVTRKPKIAMIEDKMFKYQVDFSSLDVNRSIGALCVSRPTNPTGNVLTDDEMSRLGRLAEEQDIPFLVDGAYGIPFPNIVFEEVKPFWNEHTVLSMSLSKLGLPTTRTGILVAREDIISRITAMNAIVSLSSGNIGQLLTLELFESGEILKLCRNVLRPYYKRKSAQAIACIHEHFSGIDYGIHKSEGAFFLWVWFKDLPITTKQLYERLKKRNVLVIPGQYFFYGLEEEWDHQDQCIRVSFAQNDEVVEKGVEIIADEVKKLC